MLLYNGQLVSASDFTLPLPNRGLFFNDGFFETMVWSEGNIRYVAHHVRRMQRAAHALGLDLPSALASEQQLTATLGGLARLAASQNAGNAQRLRLQLWRSGGGLYAPATTTAEWLATTQPFVAHTSPIQTADFADTVRTHASAVSFCKGPNALTYVMAARERALRGLEEVILLSGAGHVAETVAASIAWVRGNTMYTPAEATGAIAGTRLAHVRTLALKRGLDWEEGLYEPADLLSADVVFTANIAGLRPVQRVRNTLFNSSEHAVIKLFKD